jgi:DNA-binding NarL/FixJ family response regulator
MTGGNRSAGPVAVLVVDDQPHFRSVMRDVVAAAPGFQLAGEAGSGEEAIEVLDTLTVQLVILDKRMPGMGGTAACRAITQRHPEVVVLMCSVEDPDAKMAAECGAAEIVQKQHLNHRRLAELWSRHSSNGRIPASD